MACYDWRLAPDVSAGNLSTAIQASKGLVEAAYASDSNTKVYLAAHGNGVLYALSLLNSQVGSKVKPAAHKSFHATAEGKPSFRLRP